MSKLFSILILLCCVHTMAHAQPKRKIRKMMELFGFEQLNDTLFISRTEVTNAEWLRYLYLLHDSNRVAYQHALPDSLVWDRHFQFDTEDDRANAAVFEKFYRYSGFRLHPVVGVSHQQATAHCQWATCQFKTTLDSLSEEKGRWQFLNKWQTEVKVRLPKEGEWMGAAWGKLPKEVYDYGYTDVYGKPPMVFDIDLLKEQLEERLGVTVLRKQLVKDIDRFYRSPTWPLLNCRYPRFKVPYFINYREQILPSHWVWFKDSRISSIVNTGRPNSIGLYNMIGNVAEMTQRPGIAKGGSWYHQLSESKISDRQLYRGPQAWLGFRYVAVVRAQKL